MTEATVTELLGVILYAIVALATEFGGYAAALVGVFILGYLLNQLRKGAQNAKKIF